MLGSTSGSRSCASSSRSDYWRSTRLYANIGGGVRGGVHPGWLGSARRGSIADARFRDGRGRWLLRHRARLGERRGCGAGCVDRHARLAHAARRIAIPYASARGSRSRTIELTVLVIDVTEQVVDASSLRTTYEPGGSSIVTMPAFAGAWTSRDDLNDQRAASRRAAPDAPRAAPGSRSSDLGFSSGGEVDAERATERSCPAIGASELLARNRALVANVWPRESGLEEAYLPAGARCQFGRPCAAGSTSLAISGIGRARSTGRSRWRVRLVRHRVW